MWEHYESHLPWDQAKWEIKSKVNKDLASHPFNNVMKDYADWASNMPNHLIGCNQGYGKILYLAQKETYPITYERLKQHGFPGIQVDLVWVARAMWAFIYDNVTMNMKRTLGKNVAASETLNGLELWRRLFVENDGGAVETQVQERDCFIRFPQCPDPKYLNEYLNTWETLAGEYGVHLPEEHLMSMLLNVLPSSTRTDVRKYLKDHPFKTHKDVIAHLQLDINHEIDEKVAEALRTRRFGDLPGYDPKSVQALQHQKPEAQSPLGAEPARGQGTIPTGRS